MKCFGGCELVSHEGINVKNGKDEIRLQTKDGAKIAAFEYAGHCQSAAKAINSHDALVEALTKCREGYSNLIGLSLLPHSGYEDKARKCIKEIDKALEMAKGDS